MDFKNNKKLFVKNFTTNEIIELTPSKKVKTISETTADDFRYFDDVHCFNFEFTVCMFCGQPIPNVQHGRWLSSELLYTTGQTVCSICKTQFYVDDLQNVGENDGLPNYCPHCGAKMDGGGEDESESF